MEDLIHNYSVNRTIIAVTINILKTKSLFYHFGILNAAFIYKTYGF